MSFFKRLGKFAKKVVAFERENLRHIGAGIKEDPTRLLKGAIDPFGSKLWGYKAGLVTQLGGATKEAIARARAKGIDTGPGEAMHQLAGAIATSIAGGFGAGKLAALKGPVGTISKFVSPEDALALLERRKAPPPPPETDVSLLAAFTKFAPKVLKGVETAATLRTAIKASKQPGPFDMISGAQAAAGRSPTGTLFRQPSIRTGISHLAALPGAGVVRTGGPLMFGRKRKRINPTNVHALRRALRRVEGFIKIEKRVDAIVSRAGRAASRSRKSGFVRSRRK